MMHYTVCISIIIDRASHSTARPWPGHSRHSAIGYGHSYVR